MRLPRLMRGLSSSLRMVKVPPAALSHRYCSSSLCFE